MKNVVAEFEAIKTFTIKNKKRNDKNAEITNFTRTHIAHKVLIVLKKSNINLTLF